MTWRTLHFAWLIIAIVAGYPAVAHTQAKVASWLDEPRPASWNKPGASIPGASKMQGTVDPRCRAAARPPQLDEDKRLRAQDWDLVGAYQGGWQILVIRGTSGYDGMCRPLRYQDFVFVRGVFAGTLSPRLMDSRADGALLQLALQSDSRLTAEYARYAATDPLCCPSRTSSVVFEISKGPPAVRPVSVTTLGGPVANRTSSQSTQLEGTWQLVRFQGSDDTTLTPDDRTKYTIELAAGGRLTARIDCNRGRGSWKSSGASQIELGPLALTRAQCPAGSLHDQIVKQWGNIRSYVIRNGHLFLALMADGGIYEFEPVSRKTE